MNAQPIGTIRPSDPGYPRCLKTRLGKEAPDSLTTIGNIDLLNGKLLGLVCSVRCPGNAILNAYETAKRVAHSDWIVVSGFHSPMEKESLRILLRAKHPVVVCVARSLAGMRIPLQWREHLEESRMLLLSPFSGNARRSTTSMAQIRNQVVVALSEKLWMPHASPGGKTQLLAERARSWKVTIDNGSGVLVSSRVDSVVANR